MRRKQEMPARTYAAHIHRFGDTVAVSLTEGPTQYMTPQEAEEFGLLLIKYSQDVRSVKFANSGLVSRVVEKQESTS